MLTVSDIVAGYGGIVAVRSVSLTVTAGQMACLVGANGAGKTTLLKALSGLVPLRQGKVMFDGEDITHKSAHEIAQRGLLHVPEGRHIFGAMTVEENLRVGASAAQDRKADIEQDLVRVFRLFPILQERRRQIAGQLSGGQQQMLAIGRALLGRPRMLLLDEPSLGLAPNLVSQVYDALLALNQDGLAILVVEQNAQRAMQLTDQTYVIHRGEIVLQGASAELCKSADIVSHYLGQVRTVAPRPHDNGGL